MKKRLLSLVMAFVMCLSLLPTAAFADSAAGDVIINEANFPDPVFRAYVKTLPGGADGSFTQQELSQITELNCSRQEITDLTGIEYFTMLTDVNIEDTNVYALDLRNQPNLNAITVGGSPLTCVGLHPDARLHSVSTSTMGSYPVANQTALSDLSPAFDVSRVSNVIGGNFDGGTVNFTSDKIRYKYKLSDFSSLELSLSRDGGPEPEEFNATLVFLLDFGGHWTNQADDSSDIIVTVPLIDGKGTLPADKVPTAAPNDGYIAEGWDVTPNTEVGGITGDATYVYYFDKLRSEATVTFKVVNGTWADKTTENKVVKIPLINNIGTLPADKVPTGMIPNENYLQGSWTPQLNLDLNGVTNDVIYTYTCIKDTSPRISVGGTEFTDPGVDHKGPGWEWNAGEHCMYFEKDYTGGPIRTKDMYMLRLSKHATLDAASCWDSESYEPSLIVEKDNFVNVDLKLVNCQLAEGTTAPTRVHLDSDGDGAYQLSLEPDETRGVKISVPDDQGREKTIQSFSAPVGEIQLFTLNLFHRPITDDITIWIRGQKTPEAVLAEAQPVSLPYHETLSLTVDDMAQAPGDSFTSCLAKVLDLGTLKRNDVISVDSSGTDWQTVSYVNVYLVDSQGSVVENWTWTEPLEFMIRKDGNYRLFFACYGNYHDMVRDGLSVEVNMTRTAGVPTIDLTEDPVPAAGDKWTWDKATHTLTLKDGFRYDPGKRDAIYQEGDLNLVVEGRANISSDHTAIMVKDGDLTIQMKAGSALNITAGQNAIYAETTLGENNKPRDEQPKGSVHILGEKIPGKLPLLRINSESNGIDVDMGFSASDCKLELSAGNSAIWVRPWFDDPSQTVTLKNCLTNITSDYSAGIYAIRDLIVDGGRLNADCSRHALTTGGRIVLRNDPVLDLRSGMDDVSTVVESIDDDFNISGVIQLLDKNCTVIYEGTWDEGVKSGAILMHNTNEDWPELPPTYVIRVKLEDGSEVDAKAILSKQQDLPVENPFTDVNEKDYFYDYVLWAVENGITSGISLTEFGPDLKCTRAQIVTFLWNAEGQPAAEGKSPFKDVKQGDWYYDAVLWAVENDITSGIGEGKFGPDLTCSRAEAMTFLWKYLEKPEAEGKVTFTDVKESDWFYAPVQWAVENGITAGVGGGKFGSADDCLRAQIVTFIYRALNK